MTPGFPRGAALAASACLALLGGCAQAAVRPCNGDIPGLFEKASPAVVMISGQSINPYKLQNRVSRVIGSGFVYDAARGLVITNSHVAFGRQTLFATLDDGTVVPARLLGADPIFDIAVVEIPRPDTGRLVAVPLGDSERLRIGENVIAIGNPLGLDQTVTRGIVSGLNRVLPETPLSLGEPLIQTDAPINPGNSGGPLLNLCGEVVGMNTAIVADAQNIGFAIPANLIKSVVPALVRDGRVIRPWIGFHGSPIGADLRKVLKLPLADGLLVEVVEPGSPAESAGMQGGNIEFTLGTTSLLLGGDIVVSVNGVAATDEQRLAALMRSLKVGSRLNMRVFRDGATREVTYTLPERPLLPGDLPEEQQATLPQALPRGARP
ncbi:MAG TPA: trypsin-like peptidase domain-containing protein [Burkholderiales bacterium]|jgi:S1-C subfamily serine protease|nr:trypsin-like peptidase domain-containing protein [Burkholderiales bacterium]